MSIFQNLFAVVIGVILAVSPAYAQNLTKDDLRQLVRSEDTGRVEKAMQRAQAAYIRGEATADDLRDLYGTFTTTDPQMIKFTGMWVETWPKSAFAHTARAWVYYHAGFRVRGELSGQETPKVRHDEFAEMIGHAANHTLKAFELNKEFIPAADAMLKVGTVAGFDQATFEALDYTMTTRPNWGTLWRATYLTNPGWGGDFELLRAMCEHYGPMVPTGGPDMTLRCKMVGGWSFHPQSWQGIRSEIFELDDPFLDDVRSKVAVWSGLVENDRHTDFLLRYFDRQTVETAQDPVHLRQLIKTFDEVKASQSDIPLIEPRFMGQFLDYAFAEIEYDPFNADLLDIIEFSDAIPVKEHGYLIFSANENFEPIDQPTKVEYAGRRLIGKPYDPDLWFRYAEALEATDNVAGFFAGTPYRTEGVVRSEYSVHSLNKMLVHFIQQVRRLKRANPEKSPNLAEFAKTADRDSNIYCPFLQTYLLHEYQCNRGDQHPSCTSSRYQSEFDRLRAIAENSDKCRYMIGLSVDELTFENQDLLANLGPAPLP